MRKLVTGVPSSHASPVIKLVSRSSTVPASTAWTCGRGRPGDRPHPILKLVDPATSSAPCNVCVARQGGSSRQARPRRSSGSPGHQAKLGWSMSYVTMVLVTTLSPKSAEERLPEPGRVVAPGTDPLGRSPWSTMPSRTRAGLAASRQVAHHPDECVQSPWGMRCRTMPEGRRTGFPPSSAGATS